MIIMLGVSGVTRGTGLVDGELPDRDPSEENRRYVVTAVEHMRSIGGASRHTSQEFENDADAGIVAR